MISKKLFKFDDILAANQSRENLAEKIEENERNKIAAVVIERKRKDKESMKPWLAKVEQGLDLMRLQYKPKTKPFGEEESYNIQFPLVLDAVQTVSSRLFSKIHKDNFLANPRVLGKDPENSKEMRALSVKHYLNYVAVDYPYSTWMEEQSKMYPRYVLMGTQIKQVLFDSITNTFDNQFIPYKDVFIHHHSASLEKAPAITVARYLSRNEIIERINEKKFVKYDYMKPILDTATPVQDTQTEYGQEIPHSTSITFLESHCWLDLDGDNYEEPYIAVVDEEAGKLVRLLPRINEKHSNIIADAKLNPKVIKLLAECFFTDYHFLPDPEGHFWSYGLAHTISPTNAAVNELLNQMINVAVLATKQGGFISAGGRGMQGRKRMDMTKYHNVPVSADDLNKVVKNFDIKDPSPVTKEITLLLIETGQKMASIAEVLTGDMPNRELPTGTALALQEQALEAHKALYKRIHNALSKELQIMCRILVQEGNTELYKEFLEDPEADLKADFDLTSLDLSINSDAVSASASETIVKYQAFTEMAAQAPQNPYISQQVYLTKIATVLDIIEDGLVVEPPPPSPDPAIAVAQEQNAIKKDEVQKKFLTDQRKADNEEKKVADEGFKDRAVGEDALSKATHRPEELAIKRIQANKKPSGGIKPAGK